MRGLVRGLLRRAGYDLVRYPPPDFSPEDLALDPGGGRVHAHHAPIVDDYGQWLGARKAVDEYYAEHGVDILLARVDHSARIGVKR